MIESSRDKGNTQRYTLDNELVWFDKGKGRRTHLSFLVDSVVEPSTWIDVKDKLEMISLFIRWFFFYTWILDIL